MIFLAGTEYAEQSSKPVEKTAVGEAGATGAQAADRVKQELQTPVPKGVCKPAGCKQELKSPAPAGDPAGVCSAAEPCTPNSKRGRDEARTPNAARTNPGSNRKSSVKRRRMRGKTPGSASKAREQPAASTNNPVPPGDTQSSNTATPSSAKKAKTPSPVKPVSEKPSKGTPGKNTPEKATETKGTPSKKNDTPEKPAETKGTPSKKHTPEKPAETKGTPSKKNDTPEKPAETKGTPSKKHTPEKPAETKGTPTPEKPVATGDSKKPSPCSVGKRKAHRSPSSKSPGSAKKQAGPHYDKLYMIYLN